MNASLLRHVVNLSDITLAAKVEAVRCDRRDLLAEIDELADAVARLHARVVTELVGVPS